MGAGRCLGVGGRCCMSREPHKQACMWEQEADPWAGTPHDSALHGRDSCFMSMGCHKFHPGAFSAAAAAPPPAPLSFPFFTRPHLSRSLLLLSLRFFRASCRHVSKSRLLLCKCWLSQPRKMCPRTFFFFSLSLLRLNLLIRCVTESPTNLTQCVYLCTLCVCVCWLATKVAKKFTASALWGASCVLLSNGVCWRCRVRLRFLKG